MSHEARLIAHRQRMMHSTRVLTEISNGQQQRRKVAQTYGRKNGRLPKFQQAEQSIFGNDDSDLENGLAKLTIQPQKLSDNVEVTAKPIRHITLDKKTSTEQSSSALRSKVSHSTFRRPEPDHHTSSLKQLLEISNSTEVESFKSFGGKLTKHFAIEKVGEGSFAEVFKITPTSSTPSLNLQEQHPVFRATGLKWWASNSQQSYTSIIKVIPLVGTETPARVLDRCSSVESVSHEVNILKQLDPVHGFTRFRGLRLVKGRWPDSFLQAYRDFRMHHRKRAINAPPDQDFEDTQIYALVEMDDAGTEISLIKKPSVFQVWDIFWISTILLANAEECIEFEHRDLHMSNICVKGSSYSRSSQEVYDVCEQPLQRSLSRSTDQNSQAESNLDIHPDRLTEMTRAPDNKIGLSELRVTVIDYTVARARLSEAANIEDSPCKPHKSKFASTRRSTSEVMNRRNENDIIFDPMTFTSDPFAPDPSDPESHLQNLTYKKARAIAMLNETCANSSKHDSTDAQTSTQPDRWRAFIPRTNVVWLGYLLQVLISRARGRTGKLRLLKGKPGKGGNSKMVKELQEQMWTTLTEVSDLLNGRGHPDMGNAKIQADKNGEVTENENEVVEEPAWTDEELEKVPTSSMAVLETAVQTGWVSAEDIHAFRTVLEAEGS